MTSRIARVLVVVLAALSLAGTATAYAHLSKFEKHVSAALNDCANSSNGSLKHHYSLKVLQAALKDAKAETIQYTGCADVLTAAIRAQSLGHPKPPSGPSPTHGNNSGHPVTTHHPTYQPGQRQIQSRVDKLASEGGAPTTLPSGQTVTPGTVTSHSASFLSNLPTPLLIVLAALLAVVVAVSGRAAQNIVRTRRSR